MELIYLESCFWNISKVLDIILFVVPVFQKFIQRFRCPSTSRMLVSANIT